MADRDPVVRARPKVKGLHGASLYSPEYCEVVIRMGGQGCSEAEMAVWGCGVTRSAMRKWARKHPEFAEALDYAREAALAWWETTGRHGLKRPNFNQGLYKTIVAARFRHDGYAENVTVSGDAEAPIVQRIERVIVRPADRNA